MIIEAIETLKERSGSSKIAITNYIRDNFKVEEDQDKLSLYVKSALKMGLKYDRLKKASGVGVSGSFLVKGSSASTYKGSKSRPPKSDEEKAAEKKKSKPKPKAKASPKKASKAKKATPKKKPKSKKAKGKK